MTYWPDSTLATEAARDATACSARLRLPLRNLVWRGGAGELAGTGSGSSMDYQDQRTYLPGDDPRHINWAAYARTGNYSMKLFREEVSPTVEIVFDGSPSMFLDQEKARLSLALLYFAVQSARRDAATLSIHLLNGQHHQVIQNQEIENGSWLSHLAPSLEKNDYPPPAPRLDIIPFRNGSLRVWISDLLFPAVPAILLRTLTRQRGSGVLLVPFSNTESSPDWNGVCDFHDVETGRIEARDADASLLRRYQTSYQAHFAAWRQEATRHHLPLARVLAGIPLDRALSAETLATRALEPTT